MIFMRDEGCNPIFAAPAAERDRLAVTAADRPRQADLVITSRLPDARRSSKCSSSFLSASASR